MQKLRQTLRDLIVRKNPFADKCKASHCERCKFARNGNPFHRRKLNITSMGKCVYYEEKDLNKVW